MEHTNEYATRYFNGWHHHADLTLHLQYYKLVKCEKKLEFALPSNRTL